MLMQSYFLVPGEPSTFTLLVTGLATIGVYLVATGKLRVLRTASTTSLPMQVPLPVESPLTISDPRGKGDSSRVLDTVQAAVELLRGETKREETEHIERELSACLAAAETRIAELDMLISKSDGAQSAPPARKPERKATPEEAEVTSTP